tara:strand:- start:88 stop:1455 length:1368 start_codon:yes stop_codon:yes gene_type:complete
MEHIATSLDGYGRKGTWDAVQYSGDLWMQRALVSHPWVVPSATRADLVLLSSNLSLACNALQLWRAGQGKAAWGATSGGFPVVPLPDPFSIRARWLNSSLARNNSRPPVAVQVYTGCEKGSFWGTNSLRLTDSFFGADLEHQKSALIPYVLSRPQMARGSETLRNLTLGLQRWPERRLIHFVGHVPKFYISTTRMLIWTQINREPDVTARSHTVRCHLAPFTICDHPERLDAEFKTYCAPYCGGIGMTPSNPCRRRNANSLKKDCARFREYGINATLHLPELNANRTRQTGHLPYDVWLQEAAAHRFCVVARGDHPGTPKLADFVLLGAAGGCIPLVVVPTHFTRGKPTPALPYGRWFDWCSAAVIVSEETAEKDFAGKVLPRLRAMSAQEAAHKQRALDTIRDAFYWRVEAERPGGADYALAEACVLARQHANGSKAARDALRRSAMAYLKCAL